VQIEVILAAAIGILGIASAPLVPLVWRLWIALALSVPQVYVVPAGGAWISLAFISAYFLWPEFIKEMPGMLRSPPMIAIFSLLIIQVVSWAWAPDLFAGFRALVYALPFLFIVAATYSLACSDARKLKFVMYPVPLLMLVQLAMVVAFRLSTDLETSYMQSGIAGIFTGPNTIEALLDGTSPNNAFDVYKSGGVYVNANAAAAYLGTGAFLAFKGAGAFRMSLLKVVGLLLWIGIFFTGSKAGVVFAIFLPVMLAAARRLVNYDLASRIFAVFGLVIVATFSVVAILSAAAWLLRQSQFLADTAVTTGTRLLIWAHAAQVFADSPLFGLGYGGWQESFARYAASFGMRMLPPHNSLIQLWADSGIIAVVLAVIFASLLLRICLRLIRSPDAVSRYVGGMLFLVFGWIFLHSLGENWGILGDVRMLPILGATMGVALARDRSERMEPAITINDASE